MVKKIIILTKSKKHSGYCIAGIDFLTGEWIRLVSSDRDTEGAVPEARMYLQNGRIISIYDIIECEVVEKRGSLVQPENWLYDEMKEWKFVGTSNIDEVLSLHGYDKTNYIFYNADVKLPADFSFTGNGSLCLAHVSNAHIWVKNFDGKTTVSLNFSYKGIEYKYMRISQWDILNTYSNMRDGDYCIGEKDIVFSLTDKYYVTGKYYKVVAQILD